MVMIVLQLNWTQYWKELEQERLERDAEAEKTLIWALFWVWRETSSRVLNIYKILYSWIRVLNDGIRTFMRGLVISGAQKLWAGGFPRGNSWPMELEFKMRIWCCLGPQIKEGHLTFMQGLHLPSCMSLWPRRFRPNALAFLSLDKWFPPALA